MSLFSRKQADPPTKLPGGEDVIRAGLKVRVSKRENLINLSRSLEVPQDALLDFVAGQQNVNAEALSVIAGFLWPNARYDGASDKLVSGGKEPTPVATIGYPQAFQGERVGRYAPVTNTPSGVHPDPKLSIGTNDITPKYVPKPGWA
jgi:hypothetical protein